FYVNKHTQAIERDTITSSGTTKFIQNPQDAVNGTIRLAPVESLDLQPVTLSVPEVIKGSPFDRKLTLYVPPGFSASLYAYDLGHPHGIVLREDGTIFYSNTDAGQLVAIPAGADHSAGKTIIASGLSSPHGLELHNGALYYTDEQHVF